VATDGAEIEAQCPGWRHVYTEGYRAYGELSRPIPDQAVGFSSDGDGERPTLISVLVDD
jgi:hypothetical protein